MNITLYNLRAEYERAGVEWPWISYVEKKFELPPFTLYAVASRESDMRNIVGDHGHGIGIWQRDNRAWARMATPRGPLASASGQAWYLMHPRRQAEDAAGLLALDYRRFRDWRTAFAAYNAGAGAIARALINKTDPDKWTTGGDYGADVLARREALSKMFSKKGIRRG